METKSLKHVLKAFSRLKTDKCSVVDLDNVLIKDGCIEATNLECTIRYQVPELDKNVMVDMPTFKKVLKNFKTFSIDSVDEQKVYIKADKSTIKIANNSSDNFVTTFRQSKEETLVLNATPQDVSHLIKSLEYIGNDPLRVVFNGVALNKGHIVATNAHYLKFAKASSEPTKDIIIPGLAIELMEDLQFTNPEIGVLNESDGYIKQDGNYIYFKLIQENYVNWQSVIPESKIVATINKAELLEETKKAMLFANPTTKQIAYYFNGSVEVNAEDLDFKTEYSASINKNYSKQGEDIRIGFNGSFISKIMADIDSDVLNIELSTSNRAAVFQNEYLLMPIMLTESN